MIYLVMINVLSFFIMGLDKVKAKKQRYRISENTLLFIALIGGSLGSYLAMYCFHHKTKHIKFYMGIHDFIYTNLDILFLFLYKILDKNFVYAIIQTY